MNVLLDTCIVIDALQARQPFNHTAENIFREAARQHIFGFLTAKSIADIFYITHRHTHSNDESRRIIKSLTTVFSVIDSTGQDCINALFSDIPDFEDAMMIASAIRSKMDCIVTRNIKDYRQSPVPIFPPDEFLQKFC